MQRIRFTSPVSTNIGADDTSSPSGLKNARLDPFDGAVLANKKPVDASALPGSINPGRKPHIPWNNSLISGGGEGIIAGDSYNKYLYASNENDLVVYPNGYPTDPADTSVPYVSQITVSEDAITGANVTQDNTFGYVSYVIVPFNERGEAGPWRYYGVEFEYYISTVSEKGTWSIYLKPTINLDMTVVDAAYIEVYRTKEGLTSAVAGNFRNRSREVEETFTGTEYLYLDRFDIGGGNISYITVVDDKTWHPDTAQSGLLQASDGEVPTLEKMIELRLVSADVVEPPTSVLRYSINVWDCQPSGGDGNDADFDCSLGTHSWEAPGGFSARTMMMHQGVMLYGDVAWSTKYPAVSAFTTGGGTVYFQYEYQIYDKKYYGPRLRMINVGKTLIAWQGESALLMYDSGGLLLRRLVPNAQGMYLSDFTENQAVPAEGGDWNQVVRSLWTFSAANTYGVGSGAMKSVTASIREDNVIFLSEQYRPLEVTFDQFYLPDNSACRAITPARIEEDESLTDYNGYAFTDRSVFYWARSDRDVKVEYVEQTIGLKYNPFNQGMAVPIRAGVAFAGTNDGLYIMSGRRIQRIDVALNLWTEIRDIAYNAFEEEIVVLTDTGVWYYDLEFYQGFFKQVDKYRASGTNKHSISYIGATVGGTDLNHILYHEETSGDSLVEDSLLEYSSETYTNASVTTQPIRIGTQSKISELRVDHDHGPKVRNYNITTGQATVTFNGSGDSVFDDQDIGCTIWLQGAGAAGANLEAKITAVAGDGLSATIDTNASTTVSGKQALWPIVSVVHTFRSPEEHTNTFGSYPWARRFPRGYGIEHKLEVQNFQRLRELHISMREE